ncbi:MAG: C_GCAxxG_C_C family protein [Phycisphaerales bacterium]|nr:MAG: C_GCAxxG_C_C family protein [Phycisphaerales bacterium]
MSNVQDAVSAFESGFNCSEAVVWTYGPDLGLAPLDCFRVSCGFGGGMRRADTCGAVAGALIVLGLRFGPKDISDSSSKTTVYSKVVRFCSEFRVRSSLRLGHLP